MGLRLKSGGSSCANAACNNEAEWFDGTPFVYITGYGSNDEQLLGLGASAVFSKPSSLGGLRPGAGPSCWSVFKPT